MSKTVKIVIGSVLMTLGVVYLFLMFMAGLGRKDDARYFVDSFLEVEYKGADYLGSSAVTDWGEELEERDGYVYYCLDFEVENLSSGDYYNPPTEAIRFRSDYSTMEYYEGRLSDYENMFYQAAVPKLPGKTRVSARIYLQAREDMEEVTAWYQPAYEEDEVEIPIRLEKPEEQEVSPEFPQEARPRAHL